MKLDAVRRRVLALPEASEAPKRLLEDATP
jgi:hypothetical protein